MGQLNVLSNLLPERYTDCPFVAFKTGRNNVHHFHKRISSDTVATALTFAVKSGEAVEDELRAEDDYSGEHQQFVKSALTHWKYAS